MAATGGSIESVTLAGRTFAVAADVDSQRDLGGYENETQPNGDLSARLVKKANSWMVSDLSLAVDDSIEDAEYLQDLADGNGFFPCTIAYASAEVYQGTGQITGGVKTSSQNATASVSLSGSGKLTKQ